MTSLKMSSLLLRPPSSRLVAQLRKICFRFFAVDLKDIVVINERVFGNLHRVPLPGVTKLRTCWWWWHNAVVNPTRYYWWQLVQWVQLKRDPITNNKRFQLIKHSPTHSPTDDPFLLSFFGIYNPLCWQSLIADIHSFAASGKRPLPPSVLYIYMYKSLRRLLLPPPYANWCFCGLPPPPPIHVILITRYPCLQQDKVITFLRWTEGEEEGCLFAQ